VTTYQPGEIKAAVRVHYGSRAEQVLGGSEAGCCSGDAPTNYATQLYGAEAVADMPDSVVSYGCGNPTANAGMRPGETVLDLGSGAGLDCFLSARQVGDSGHVIGLDMTDSMVELARANQAKLGLTNTEFRMGEMEAMPVDDASVDVIISNCVINLSPDKDAVFRESFRVLRPGGRLHVSDVVLMRPLDEAERGDLAAWAGCTSGALLRDDYRGRLERAGFVDISIEVATESEQPWRSALITAYKRATDGTIVRPAGAAGLPMLQTTIPLTVVGEGAACCSTSSSSCC
jgi:SAM-dependent methyltransferase